MLCPSCGAENIATRKFCRACGTSLAPICSACGTRNEPGDRFCGECGGALASRVAGQESRVSSSDPGLTTRDPRPATSEHEERRPVSILFADLVGFTALSERLDAEIVRDLTTECFRRLVAEVARYEGTVDKFIGDSVMALFGAPTAHEDDPARALRAALAMQRALATFNEELERERGLRLALRIGVETGEVVAGLRDVGGIREYTVIGDAVNVAARLQAATEPGAILVGEVTEQRTRAAFTFRPVTPLTLRGKERPVAASILIGPRAEARDTDGGIATDALRRAPMVGRAAELGALERSLEELRRGRGQVATIVGEPGLGKSRLLAELRMRAEGVGWARCQAFAHEQGLSYGLTRDLIRELCELDADESEAAAAQRLRARLEVLGTSETYPVLAHLLTLPLDPVDRGRLDGLPPQELRHLIFRAVAELLERAATQPLALELDDLHWADPSSIDLLSELTAVAERAPVLFLCAFRPERDAPVWALRERLGRDLPHRYTEIILQPLSEEASAELVARLLSLDELPAGLQTVLERAAGTPLWVEELVRTLVERGLLVPDDGHWRATADLDHVEIPDTLHALIVARIDRLGEARPTLQTASVIGRRFGQRVLERVAGESARLREHLLRAQRVDLVRELATIPELEYGFKHVLTQEAAYATLLVRRRRELHRQVADALEELYPERVDELHAILAYHYQRAEVWTKALEHATQAAEAARADYANREAIEHYGRALAAAKQAGVDPPERRALHEARGQVHDMLGEFEPARADYEAALALAEGADDRLARARLLGTLGMLWGGHKDYQRGLELTRQSVAAAEQADDPRTLAEARVRLGVIGLNMARMAEARSEFEGALAIFEQLEDETGVARTLDVLAMVAMCSGDMPAAARRSSEAVPRLLAIGDRVTAATCTYVQGVSLAYLGDRTRGETEVRRALVEWVEMENRAGEAFGHWNIAQLVDPYGDYALMLRESREGLRLAREIEHREWTAGGLCFLGRTLRLCGDVAGARRAHDEMLAVARELGTTLWVAQALGELGLDLVDEGDEQGGVALMAEGIDMAGDAWLFSLRTMIGQADVALRRGRPAEALAIIRRFAPAILTFPAYAVDAQRIEGEALAKLGETEQSEATLRKAKADALTLGTSPAHWSACLALADLLDQTGRPTDAAAERAEALTILEAVACSLSDPELRCSFAQTEPIRRARGSNVGDP